MRTLLNQFFREFGRRRSLRIIHVSADGASWINNVVRFHCRRAGIGLPPLQCRRVGDQNAR